MSESLKQFNPMKYYIPEQKAYLSQRQTLLGQERVIQIMSEWNTLRAQFSLGFDQRIDPADKRIQTLAKRVVALKKELIDNNSGFEEIFEKGAQELSGINPREGRLMAYVLKAMKLFEGHGSLE